MTKAAREGFSVTFRGIRFGFWQREELASVPEGLRQGLDHPENLRSVLSVELGREPSTEELAEELGVEYVGSKQRHLRRPRPGGEVRLLRLGTLLLPAGARDRWFEEWRANLSELRLRRERFAFIASLILNGIPSMAWTLRGSRYRSRDG